LRTALALRKCGQACQLLVIVRRRRVLSG
jgi:hypothetical protein